MKRFIFIAFLLFFISDSASASFDTKGLQPLPPFGIFSTLSAESLKQNQIGMGIGFEKSSEPNFNRTFFQLAYGLHDRLEFNFTIPYVFKINSGTSGFEDFTMAIKHRLIGESRYSPALAYVLMVSAHSGRKEFSTEGGIGGGLILTKKVGPFKGHLNCFYTKPEKSELKDQYLVNLGAELAVTHNSKILTEVVGRKNYFRNKLDLLEWRLGYRITTADNIYTTIGAGFDIKNRTPDYRLLFSVSIILPKQKKYIKDE